MHLHPDDPDAARDVFVRDLVTHATTLVSRAAGAAGEKGNSDSSAPSISIDGRYVAFESFATNLLPDDADATIDVFVRDLVANTTTLVSRATGAAGAKGGDNSFAGSISADGSLVAFYTTSALDAADTNGAFDVYVPDVTADTTTLVSRPSGVAGVGDAASLSPSISGDGCCVAFGSFATNLHADDSDGTNDIFVRNLAANTTTLVSRRDGDTGPKGNGGSFEASIASDGCCVAFDSAATNLDDDDPDGVTDVFVSDLVADTTTLASRVTGPFGEKGNAESLAASISADGKRVAFQSDASNPLDPADPDGTTDIYLRDVEASTTTLISRATGAAGAKGNGFSIRTALSPDGSHVAFGSMSTNLHPGDPDGTDDVFLRDLLGNLPDVTIPDTTITSGPSGLTDDTPPTFTFVSNESGSTFACRVDAGGFSACSSPDQIGPLANGQHTFEVRATDAAANTDPTPASRTFTVNSAIVEGEPEAKRTQKGPKVKVDIVCDEPCAIEAKGKVVLKDGKKRELPAVASKSKRTIKLKPVTRELAAGESATLKLKPKGKKAKKALKKALKQRASARAKVTVTITDEAGHVKVEKLSVKLKK